MENALHSWARLCFMMSLHELIHWVAVTSLFKIWLMMLQLTALAVVTLEFSTFNRFTDSNDTAFAKTVYRDDVFGGSDAVVVN